MIGVSRVGNLTVTPGSRTIAKFFGREFELKQDAEMLPLLPGDGEQTACFTENSMTV